MVKDPHIRIRIEYLIEGFWKPKNWKNVQLENFNIF